MTSQVTRVVQSVLIILVAALMTACAGQRHRDTVSSGVLKLGTTQQAFLDVWGTPERTRTAAADTDEKRYELNRYFLGTSFSVSKTTYEIWEYPRRDVVLIFSGGALAGWKTDKTTEQLRDQR